MTVFLDTVECRLTQMKMTDPRNSDVRYPPWQQRSPQKNSGRFDVREEVCEGERAFGPGTKARLPPELPPSLRYGGQDGGMRVTVFDIIPGSRQLVDPPSPRLRRTGR